MTTKTTGAEYKAYLDEADPAWWPEGAYIDDDLLTVDGKPVDGSGFNPATLADGSLVVIEGGAYFRNGRDADPISLETHFKRWRRAQTKTHMVVEVDKTKVDDMKAVIKANGGKVIGS